MTLTRIAAVTSFLGLLVQGAVLFGWDITGEQQAWLTSAILAAGSLIHVWFNPAVPVGVKND